MKSTRQFMTQAECDQIASLLGRKHTSFLRQRFFEVSVRRDSHGVYAKVIFRSRDGSFYYPVEARAAHMDHDLDEAAAAQLLCEYIGEYFFDRSRHLCRDSDTASGKYRRYKRIDRKSVV